MVALVFSPMLGSSRIVVSLVGALLIGPLVALIVRDIKGPEPGPEQPFDDPAYFAVTWGAALGEGLRDWARHSLGYALRLAPIMAAAGFASGLVIQWISPDTVSAYLGNDLLGVAVAATVGVLINVPLLFEIPLVALLLLLGMGEAPAAALLFTAAAGGPATFWALARFVSRKAIAAFAGATWAFGLASGVAILGVSALYPHLQGGLRQPDGRPSRAAGPSVGVERVGVVREARAAGALANRPLPPAAFVPLALDAPGAVAAVVFDYDRDGDNDVYATAPAGHAPRLLRNDGDGVFADVAAAAGVAGGLSGSTAAACDLNNDGYSELYVGTASDAGTDRLFLNNRDGTFSDITEAAFGSAANLRPASSVACADVDGDGWLDVYVGNVPEQPGPVAGKASLPGLYNALYLNNGDLTFDEVAEAAGVRGGQVTMRGLDGLPVLVEQAGNPGGASSGRTHAVLFFDHDDDGDTDLWVASDGDRLRVYRNDSSPRRPRFTPVARDLGVDRIGNWKSMAVGDFDGDADLDVLVVNGGPGSLSSPPRSIPAVTAPTTRASAWARATTCC